VVGLFTEFTPIPTVLIETEHFSGEVIGMYEMPHQSVISALTAPHGPVQLMAMLDIFKLALVDQKKREDLEAMSFNGIAEILGQWTFKSTVGSASSPDSFGELDSRLNPQKIIEMLEDPDMDFEDVLDELNSQLSDFEPLIAEENRKKLKPEPEPKKSFFGCWKKHKGSSKSD
jgi:hypothetical protein